MGTCRNDVEGKRKDFGGKIGSGGMTRAQKFGGGKKRWRDGLAGRGCRPERIGEGAGKSAGRQVAT